jgi:hypothetical protein
VRKREGRGKWERKKEKRKAEMGERKRELKRHI